MRPALTGRMTARVIEPPRVGERCAVVGWKIGEDGRKLYSGTALYTEDGRLCAVGTCTWIVLKD
jgi:acyl-coenzyme A thioesterase PaaI-like protein